MESNLAVRRNVAMNSTDLAYFRETTIEARLWQVKERARAGDAIQELEEWRVNRAKEQIPKRIEIETELGADQAIVMAVGRDDYERPAAQHDPEHPFALDIDHTVCRAEWLKGACASAYKYCTDVGLNPTVDHWFSSARNESGFNIVVHWM